MDGFGSNWRQMHIDCAATGSLLNTLSTTAHQLSEGCNAYAQHIEDLRSDLEHMAEVAAGVAVVGVALTFFTLGASDAVAAGGEAAIAAEAGVAAAAMSAEAAASAEVAVLAEAASVVDAAAARIVIAAAAAATATTLASAPAAAAPPPGPAAPGAQPLPADPASVFPLLPPARQQRFQQWMGQMHADGRTSPALAPNGKKPKIDACRAYQLRVAGSTEYNLHTTLPNKTGGQLGMNADGVRAQDGAAVDAKCVGRQSGCRSPLRLGNVGSVPSYVYASTEKSQRDELVKYDSAFKDPRNQVNHLEVITNDEKAAAYYDAMMAAQGVPAETRNVK
ncbi:restriction endonuclease fold toxin-2 domain-containing protein [Streptomyces decoyicus]|uniref:restriction endonuclease fold toxin-2 domain-containing protein n=1 Tax=Streptomyces decoyicus TaxID=249567 RepID=UPI0038658A5B|nr:hypothetical protein OG532_00150 [Streptomyces decoyicus]